MGMGIGQLGGLGRMGLPSREGVGGFSPASLFAGGTEGVWYDPSDMSTLWQDSARTVPVTADGDPVGCMDDKSGNGNHALQTSGTLRPLYRRGPNPLVMAPLSELAVNGTFDTVTTGWTARASSVLSVVGAALRVTNGAASFGYAFQSVAVEIGKTYVVNVRGVSATLAIVNLGTSEAGGQYVADTNISGTSYQKTIVATSTSLFVVLKIGSNTIAAVADFDDVSVKEVPIDTPYIHWVQFDGSNDCLATAAIDFTGTDKISAFAGARKLNDAAVGMIAELGIGSAAGSFSLYAPGSASAATFGSNLKGTTEIGYGINATAAPYSAVLSGLFDIGAATKADELKPRLNGVLTQSSGFGTNAGTGNFGNHALNLGSRNSASFRYNGNINSLIVLGRAATAAEITSSEQYAAAKTGVIL